jgi:hypothetical protein
MLAQCSVHSSAFLCTLFVLCAPCCLSCCLLCSYLYLTNCSIGISAVLFGLKVVLHHDSPGFTNIFGVALPTKVTTLHMHEARCNGIVVQCQSKLSIVKGTTNRQAASCECLKIHACVAAALVMIVNAHHQTSQTKVVSSVCGGCLQYMAWAELLLASAFNPRASFIGHLAGIAAGWLHVRVLAPAAADGLRWWRHMQVSGSAERGL